jgi:predicted AAA+ superfamily ATPase
LAGRTAVLKLLPLSVSELSVAKAETDDIDTKIFKGAYPRLYDKDIMPNDFYPYYIQTYVERDVRQVKNIGDLSAFVKFIKLCAGRIGQVLNVSSLAGDCGISVSAANSWLSVLETGYVCFLLQPDFNNFTKRVVKSPKLYFYDTGLACSLLGITSAQQVATHYLKGGLFENLVISETIKKYYNQGIEPDLRYFRDSNGLEIDLLDYTNGQKNIYEIKSGSTFSTDYFKGIIKYSEISGVSADQCTVIYNGGKKMETSNGRVVNFFDMFAS